MGGGVYHEFQFQTLQTASEAEAMTMNFHVTKRRKWKGTVHRKQ